MIKKLFTATIATSIILAIGLNIYQSKEEASLSKLALTNIECLAMIEYEDGYTSYTWEECTSERNTGSYTTYDMEVNTECWRGGYIENCQSGSYSYSYWVRNDKL